MERSMLNLMETIMISNTSPDHSTISDSIEE